ncbi:hypothetical protein [Reichenbachiella sp. MSK19-1]|uniref:hypothetical protein n=1 Tax=Reichenbachiella sp. MSK19-1 TaxID=1897631 RepID=UPI0011C342C6|nr:hypothetical protein [Reichenbachiella sp. MSK19-1]
MTEHGGFFAAQASDYSSLLFPFLVDLDLAGTSTSMMIWSIWVLSAAIPAMLAISSPLSKWQSVVSGLATKKWTNS